jgi:hypothetical protein
VDSIESSGARQSPICISWSSSVGNADIGVSEGQSSSAGDVAGGVSGCSSRGNELREARRGEMTAEDSLLHLFTETFTTSGSFLNRLGIISSCSSDWLLGMSSSSSASFPETAVVASRCARLEDDFERMLQGLVEGERFLDSIAVLTDCSALDNIRGTGACVRDGFMELGLGTYMRRSDSSELLLDSHLRFEGRIILECEAREGRFGATEGVKRFFTVVFAVEPLDGMVVALRADFFFTLAG